MLEGAITDTFALVAQFRSASPRLAAVGQISCQHFFRTGSIGIELTYKPIQSVLIGGRLNRHCSVVWLSWDVHRNFVAASGLFIQLE
jgi:hypothetical protein